MKQDKPKNSEENTSKGPPGKVVFLAFHQDRELDATLGMKLDWYDENGRFVRESRLELNEIHRITLGLPDGALWLASPERNGVWQMSQPVSLIKVACNAVLMACRGKIVVIQEKDYLAFSPLANALLNAISQSGVLPCEAISKGELGFYLRQLAPAYFFGASQGGMP